MPFLSVTRLQKQPMKKLLFLLLLFSIIGTAAAQTLLNRYPIELKKSSEYFQIFNAENQQNEYFTFIADKEKLTVLKYNSALFFIDSLSISRPERSLDFMVGVTFSKEGNPNLYWSAKNYEILKLIHFDFNNRTTSDLVYENNFARKKIIDVFVAKNTFHILSITPENTLKFTAFSNTGKSEFAVTFHSESASGSQSNADHLVNTILEKGITVIEARQFNPLFDAAAKVKRYLKKERYVLSFDSDRATTLFTVDLTDYSSKKELFPYEYVSKNSGSNSFINLDMLYQISANSDSISLTGIDLKTKNAVGKYQANAKQEIDFKNTPLLLQSENGKVRELKNTSKFLSKMDFKTMGLSVYSTPNYDLFTIGGVREVPSSGGVVLAIGLGIGGVMSGSDVMVGSDFLTNNMQSLYFESFFDARFEHLKVPFRPLYIDALGEFLNTNRPSVHNLFLYQNYTILNYYDSKAKEFVMRKFEDIAY